MKNRIICWLLRTILSISGGQRVAWCEMAFWLRFKGKISVEPVIFIYFMTMVFSNCLSTNMLLYKACFPAGVSAEQLGTRCTDEAAAQHVVAPINGWKVLVQQLVPTMLTMLAGTWSDRHGRRRRPLMILPIAGQIMADAASAYCAFQWSVSPLLTAAVQAITIAFTGGASMMFNGVNSYVADTTSEEWRTVKYGVLGSTIAIGGIFGMLVYGFAVINLGFLYSYLLAVCMGLVAMTVTMIFVKDVATTESTFNKTLLFEDVVRTINPMDAIRNCYRVITKRRQGHGTIVLCLVVFVCSPLTCVPLEGEMIVMYLFLRIKFKWNEIDFTFFNAYQMAIILGGTIFALSILSHKFQMNDALVGMIASTFDLIAAIAFLIVTQSWQLYFVPPLELFRCAALALTSSIASKSVGSDELGAMNAVKLFIESTTKMCFLPFYNFVYNHTIETMPSAFFLISIVLTAPLIFVFYLIYSFTNYQNVSDSSLDKSIDRVCIKPKNEISPINNSNVPSYHI